MTTDARAALAAALIKSGLIPRLSMYARYVPTMQGGPREAELAGQWADHVLAALDGWRLVPAECGPSTQEIQERTVSVHGTPPAPDHQVTGYEWELVKLPRAGGRIPTLIVSDRPGPGHRTRRYVVRMMADDLDLHGGAK